MRNEQGQFVHVELNRQCVACDSKTTYVDKRGKHQWRMYDNEWYCKNCYSRYIDNPIRNPENSKKWNPITHKKYGPKRMSFKDERIQLKENPRNGICRKCGKSIGGEYIDCKGRMAIIKRTHEHHRYGYFIIFKWFGLVELCVSCHMKEPREKRRPDIVIMKKIKGKWLCVSY